MDLTHNDEHVIVAQCTPNGSGAIGLIRITGNQAITVAQKIAKLVSSKQLTKVPTHTIHYGSVVGSDGKQIDNVLFLVMRGPQTFTGQNTIEITCHNNPFILQNILTATITAGARMAQPGEFTKRAVLNDKIDLLQAEAINELIHANTQQTLKHSLAQLDGSFSHWISTIEKQLTKCLAFSEASFEFIDEENLAFGKQIAHIITAIQAQITKLKKTFNEQQQIRNGIRIAIIGSVNAGKSSLFNALLNKDRAIVTSIAGTTRDSIEAGLYKNGNYWTLVDTAGLRQTNDTIEQQGIKRSFDEAHQADIIILAIDASVALTPAKQAIYQELETKYSNKVIMVSTKSDLQITHLQNRIQTSSKTKQNIEVLEEEIQNKIDILFKNSDSPFLLNKRHYNLLLNIEAKLEQLQNMLNTNIQYELVSFHLQDALATLSELTGKTISEQGMNAVFREFCVGK